MKKMLLGVSILSTLAFGVSNPGDDITKATSGGANVGVPMEVRVEVLPTSGNLVLVDENNKLIDKLIFDHGKLVKGAAITDSTVEKTVKLKKADGTPLGGEGAYKVTFKAKNSSGTPVNMATPLKLQAHGVTGGGEIESKLKYRENKIDLAGTETEVVTKIQSIIEATKLNAAEVGLYIGSGTFEAEVTNS